MSIQFHPDDPPIAGLQWLRSGKVRDIYEHEGGLLLVASDRISAFDVILPNLLPGKGKILTAISTFWFEQLAGRVEHHLICTDVDAVPALDEDQRAALRGRTMYCRRLEVLPFEFVVRGYISGSGWKSYRRDGSICGIHLPEGLREAQQLPEPILTPTTKADEHDEPVDFAHLERALGADLAAELRDLSIELYSFAATAMADRGVLLADTKLEFALDEGRPVLVDEVFTPDSSRYWPTDEYVLGTSPPSFDKQIVRDYLRGLDWDRTPPGPPLPAEVCERTLRRYGELYEILTGTPAPEILAN